MYVKPLHATVAANLIPNYLTSYRTKRLVLIFFVWMFVKHRVTKNKNKTLMAANLPP